MVTNMNKVKKKVATYIEKQYKGDYSKVEVRTLDYADIVSPTDLLKWAVNAFDIKVVTVEEINANQIINCVYDALAEQCKKNYVVVELNKKKIFPNMKDLVHDFSTALSFHFFRDYGRRIDFLS